MDFTERHINPKFTVDSTVGKLKKAADYRDCDVMNQTLIDILKEDTSMNLVIIETMLRIMDNSIYLIAAPKISPGIISMNFSTKSEATYWLWICVNGLDEATLTMKEFNIASFEENLNRLRDTGFLVVPPAPSASSTATKEHI